MTPRPPESTGKLDSAETNPLPHVSSARAWTTVGETQTRAARSLQRVPRPSLAPLPSLTLPKAAPVIREKIRDASPDPRLRRDGYRLRADGTEEICADDIMLIVPKTKLPSADAIDESDILVETAQPEPFRTPTFSVHATQEILVDDVLEVQHVANQLAGHIVQREELPSTIPPPWTVDTGIDDLEFPTPPKYSGQYAALSSGSTGPRLTNFSGTEVFRRRSANIKIVIASLSAAAAVVMIAGLARLAPTSSAEGPVGIAIHAPKTLDKSVRTRTLAYGKAPRLELAETVSIDSLPESHPVRAWRRHR